MFPPECPHMRTLVKFICLRTFCHSAYYVPEISGNCHFAGKKTFVHLFFRFYLVMSSLSYVTKHDSLSLCPFFRYFFFFWEEEGSLKLFACPSVYLPLYMPVQTTVWGFLFVSVIDFNESLSRSFIFFSFTSRKTLTKICADNFLWLMFNYFKVISIFVGLISQSLKARRWSSKRYSSYRATSKSIFKTDRSKRILKVGILQMLLF